MLKWSCSTFWAGVSSQAGAIPIRPEDMPLPRSISLAAWPATGLSSMACSHPGKVLWRGRPAAISRTPRGDGGRAVPGTTGATAAALPWRAGTPG